MPSFDAPPLQSVPEIIGGQLVMAAAMQLNFDSPASLIRKVQNRFAKSTGLNERMRFPDATDIDRCMAGGNRAACRSGSGCVPGWQEGGRYLVLQSQRMAM